MNRIIIVIGLSAALIASSVAILFNREAFLSELPAAIAVAGVEIALIVGLVEALRGAAERRKFSAARRHIMKKLVAPSALIERVVRSSFGIGFPSPRLFSEGGLLEQFRPRLSSTEFDVGARYLTPALTSELIISMIWLERLNKAINHFASLHDDERLEGIYEQGMQFVSADMELLFAMERAVAATGKGEDDNLLDENTDEVISAKNEEYIESVFSRCHSMLDELRDPDEFSHASKHVHDASMSIDLLEFYAINLERVIRHGKPSGGDFADDFFVMPPLKDPKHFPIRIRKRAS